MIIKLTISLLILNPATEQASIICSMRVDTQKTLTNIQLEAPK